MAPVASDSSFGFSSSSITACFASSTTSSAFTSGFSSGTSTLGCSSSCVSTATSILGVSSTSRFSSLKPALGSCFSSTGSSDLGVGSAGALGFSSVETFSAVGMSVVCSDAEESATGSVGFTSSLGFSSTFSSTSGSF
uniref:Uncharacterized protein n=1 Tax=Opuntia streptacantha TaxID=393608 RepID=A0A7C9DHE0_OPUST